MNIYNVEYYKERSFGLIPKQHLEIFHAEGFKVKSIRIVGIRIEEYKVSLNIMFDERKRLIGSENNR